jgi:hypothetical protein
MPPPSQVDLIKSDSNSWAIKVSDPSGIAFLNANYGTLPYTYAWRELATKCPKSAQFKILRERKFFFRSLPLHNAEVLDCLSATKTTYTVTHFQFTDDGKLRFSETHERSVEVQSMLDRFEMQAQSKEWWRYMTRPILVTIFILLLISLFSFWADFGPLW